jgi:hypothetical protein
MHSRIILALLAAALSLFQAAYASGFHAGGYRECVSAG